MQCYYHPRIIKEIDLDAFGHMNHAAYLTLFEDVRWDLITKNGYGLEKMKETGMGPTILEVNIRYLKELRPRDEIIIETCFESYKGKVGKLHHRILRGEEVCCTAEYTIGLFSIKERRLVLPTEEWLRAVGIT